MMDRGVLSVILAVILLERGQCFRFFGRGAVDGVDHVVPVFAGVVVEVMEDFLCAEALRAEEELGGEVRLSYIHRKAAATVEAKFALTFRDHLCANPLSSMVRVDSKVEEVERRFVEFIDHEADISRTPNSRGIFCYISNAVALAQAAEEVLFHPCMLKASLLNPANFCHIPTDHPANIDRDSIPFFTFFPLWLELLERHGERVYCTVSCFCATCISSRCSDRCFHTGGSSRCSPRVPRRESSEARHDAE